MSLYIRSNTSGTFWSRHRAYGWHVLLVGPIALLWGKREPSSRRFGR